MSVKPTAIGLRNISRPYVKYDRIIFNSAESIVEFMQKDEIVAILKLPRKFMLGDTLTLHDIKGKIEIEFH